MMRLVQVVPSLPPPHEGVGSYALGLARALDARCCLVVGDPGWQCQSPPADVDIEVVPERRATALQALLPRDESAAVLLHYSNYGYARRGCPDWLVEGLEGWRREAPRGRLVTFFHEIHATGPPWRSSFWLAGRQRRLAMRLARLSDGAVTTLQIYADVLRRWIHGDRLLVWPVFSNVGEPDRLTALGHRSPRMVLFGGPGRRLKAYRKLARELERCCVDLQIEEVWDVGPAADFSFSRLGSISIHRRGVLSDGEVSSLLSDSQAGFIACPAAHLAKSTIYAAYCAHGVLPVSAWPRPSPDAEVHQGVHYWRPGSGPAPETEILATIATNARTWYSGHTLPRQAESLQQLLAQMAIEQL